MSLPTTLADGAAPPARRVLSRDRDTYRAIADAAGRAEILMPIVPQSGQELLIERRSLRTSSAAAAPYALFFLGEEDLRSFLDGTESPQLDVSDENHALLIPAGKQLLCVVSDLNADDLVYLSVQWRVEAT